MAKAISGVSSRLKVDGAVRLEPCLLESRRYSNYSGHSRPPSFALCERKPYEAEESFCNHSGVIHVRGGKFGIGAELDAGQKRPGQELGLKRLQSESRRLC